MAASVCLICEEGLLEWAQEPRLLAEGAVLKSILESEPPELLKHLKRSLGLENRKQQLIPLIRGDNYVTLVKRLILPFLLQRSGSIFQASMPSSGYRKHLTYILKVS